MKNEKCYHDKNILEIFKCKLGLQVKTERSDFCNLASYFRKTSSERNFGNRLITAVVAWMCPAQFCNIYIYEIYSQTISLNAFSLWAINFLLWWILPVGFPHILTSFLSFCQNPGGTQGFLSVALHTWEHKGLHVTEIAAQQNIICRITCVPFLFFSYSGYLL